MTRSSFRPRRSLVLALTLGLASAVWAAPTTGGDGAAADVGPAPARDSALPDAGIDLQSTSRTIRLLLELQGAPPPIEGAGDAQRSKNTPASAPRPALPGIELPGSLPANAPATTPPAIAAAPGAAGKVDWRVGLSGGFGNGAVGAGMPAREGGQSPQRSSRPGGSDEEMDAIKALLPEKLFALLREYREWLLLGGTVVLIVLGLSASLMSQARR